MTSKTRESKRCGATSTRRISIILNPAAGRGQGAKRRSEVDSVLSSMIRPSGLQAGITYEILETTGPGSGMALAAGAAESGADLVVAAGGDGTIGEVLNGIYGTGARLGIIPLGTGNDLTRHLGIPRDLKGAVNILFHGAPRTIDVGA